MKQNENQASFSTKRLTVNEIDELLGESLGVLDHGFIRVVDYMGGDEAIVQAARVSYGKGTKTVSEDRGLIRYLLKHKHTSPFEMCEIKLHVKMPMFVARQWIRHRTANVNEYSARYSILSKEFYIPELEQLCKQAKNNKQGRSSPIEEEKARQIQEVMRRDAEQAYETYEILLGSEYELARELARANLTVGYYTEFYWKIDLHNLLRFIELRIHPHAQYEIRKYAEVIADIVKKWCPFAYSAFEECVLGGQAFSAPQLAALKRMIAGEKLTQETSGVSKRDWSELEEFLNKA